MKGFQVKAIPIPVESAVAVVSFAVGANGMLYVGLTALANTLAEIDPRTDRARDLGALLPQENKSPGPKGPVLDKLHNALVSGPDGKLYLGQGLNIGWRNIDGFDFCRYGGGHLFSYDPKNGRREDLGIPVRANAIHGLAMDPAGKWLCGYSIPDNHFFAFDLAKREALDFGKISDYCCHNFVMTRGLVAYGAWLKVGMSRAASETGAADPKRFPGAHLLKFDAATRTLARTRTRLLFGEEGDFFGNKGIDSWVCTKAGRVFCGTVSAGLLLELDPAKETVRTVGKPAEGPRLSAMAEGPDGAVWGTAGFPKMHLFRYEPDKESITDFGPVVTEHPVCYFHAIAVLPDGTIYVGETDSERPVVYKLTPDR
ncbi:MAG: hypothetical protein AAB215_05190 [Planctomycetota bacterium]